MALKLRRGDKTRTYPMARDLIDFGREACGVDRPHEFIQDASDAMAATLAAVQADERMPAGLIDQIGKAWEDGFALARDSASLSRRGG